MLYVVITANLELKAHMLYTDKYNSINIILRRWLNGVTLHFMMYSNVIMNDLEYTVGHG